MDPQPEQIPQVLELYLQISQYPILARRIRARMRAEIFERGVISREQFEDEVKEKAVTSQRREGLRDPFAQESIHVWRQRLEQIRDHLTDFYFAYNLPHALFERIVRDVLADRAPESEVSLSFNPELAPQSFLMAQAKKYASLPRERRDEIQHHLREITVVLTKSMISDQMGFVRLAKAFFDAGDFERIAKRRIGEGKIGGKAAGMMLAWKILQQHDSADALNLRERVVIPDSYFVGADVFYQFHAVNELDEFMNQKYKPQEEIEEDYPAIQQAYAESRLPEGVTAQLRKLLAAVGRTPLIVRSSSLLEDNFGFSFAGKYDSFFCPNQGTLGENLETLARAIRRVYASVLSPDALLYRQRMGLVDYDERMAVLIQKVQGERYGDYFFPPLAGVGFSRNPYRWSQKIRPEDGLLRLVCGLGTRAVDRVANDYPRMVALSHPRLRPATGAREIRKYSQHSVDLIDLTENAFRTLPAREVVEQHYPYIRLLASEDKGSYLQPIYAPGTLGESQLVLTFDELLRNQDFVGLMRQVLRKLEQHYERPVDIEFTVEISRDRPRQFRLHLLQCRPQSWREGGEGIYVPVDEIPREDIVFLTRRMVPHGKVRQIRYIVHIDPRAYYHAPDHTTRLEIARIVGRLNRRLEGERFILMGPGRWGTSNAELGLKVTYAEIYNAGALVEMAEKGVEGGPEVSYGTHFFQDLVESEIYPLPLYLGDPQTVFNYRFFEGAPNALEALQPSASAYARYVKVIDVPATAHGRHVDLLMDSVEDVGMAYLR
ncbi:MAG: PEP/pyruvate-binding domain-containing protein [Anaerolineae bacterium]|nr:PEP/pyruvate-binding domain-containing protein [Anaerolineae bacterium]